jgi:hypothetical protein
MTTQTLDRTAPAAPIAAAPIATETTEPRRLSWLRDAFRRHTAEERDLARMIATYPSSRSAAVALLVNGHRPTA